MGWGGRIAAALMTFVLAPAVGAAQAPTVVDYSAFEIWGGVTTVVTTPSGSFVSSYSPPLLFDGTFSSHAEQELMLEGRRTIGAMTGMNAFIGRWLGVQVLADWASMDITGQNGPYEYSLFYTARLPPNDVLVPTKIAQTIPWPDTAGTLKSVVLAFNAVGRVGRTDRVSLTVSGGPAYYHFSGSVLPVAYTQFQVGGHSVLFQNDYRVTMSLDAANAWGFDVGGDLNLPLGRHTALMIGYRYFGAGVFNASAAVASATSSDQPLAPESLAEVAAHLTPVTIQLRPGSSRIVIGLKWRR